MAFRFLHDGSAARLKPDALYDLAIAAGFSESDAEDLRDRRETAIAEDSTASEEA